MGIAEQYVRAKETLLSDASICKPNREVFGEFFGFEEYKLKRKNGLARLDDACYRTLYTYVIRLRNVNSWFANKPWKQLTANDIRRVYDGLEDGTIKNQRGTPVKDRASYYNKIFKLSELIPEHPILQLENESEKELKLRLFQNIETK